MKQIYALILLLISVPGYAENRNSKVEIIENHIKNIIKGGDFRNFYSEKNLRNSMYYIESQFALNKIESKRQSYKVNGTEYHNILASVGPKNSEKIIIGAHYDVAGEQQGADDNASGVAGLLEIARILKQNENKLKYNFELVAFTLEEPPYFRTENMGSYVHAKSLSDKKEKVKFMISLEMIGYFSDEKNSQKYPNFLMGLKYPSKGNFIAGIGNSREEKLLEEMADTFKKENKIPFEYFSTDISVPGIDFSDHLNYWKFGFSAIMITDTAFLRNKNYHKSSDTINTLQFDKIKFVIDGLVLFLMNLE
ncbi:M28 family peptidase [Leptospira yasudae]|uniref:Peptidase M28 n=1 Tax=Leptospira yasudae TaxID=2202201 RepID=A0ABX9M0E9_9LEPT|nr:M28 family peptidase [Leptospira yasudae]RHX78775.1 peptidase M28 [Leptospira yasudae]